MGNGDNCLHTFEFLQEAPFPQFLHQSLLQPQHEQVILALVQSLLVQSRTIPSEVEVNATTEQ